MVGGISKGVSGLVGLGQEAYKHHQDKKATQAQGASSQQDPNIHPEDEFDDDEDDWIADDTQTQLNPVESTADDKDSKEGAVDWFLRRHPQPAQPLKLTGRLPAPVVIPQRRPDMRTRGFVRAYAPALAESGIDQAAFLDFIDGFHKDTKKHGWFHVSNIAVALSALSYTASVAPSPIVHFTALAVHTSIEGGRRLYVSKKTNSYVDEINARYFQPRGLYAMVMTYKPGSKDESEVLDFDSAAATAVDTRAADDKSSAQNFKSSSGKMLEQQLPQCCPLVFPELEKASDEQKENAFKRSLNFTRDYYDRRGQAEFAAENPNSQLTIQEQNFAGKHGDPKAYEHSGILGVATGGRIDPRRRRFDRKKALRERLGRNPEGRTKLLGKGGLVRRQFGENILYLMVVNMPSEEELQAAKEAEERMKREQPNWFEKMLAQRNG